jgi:hypothetical protein
MKHPVRIMPAVWSAQQTFRPNKERIMNDLDAARTDATLSSGGGFAFLVAYGTTLLIAGILAFFLTVEVAALVIYLGAAISVGSFAMMVIFGAAAFPFVPLFWSACYWVTAFIIRSQLRARTAAP